MFTLLIVFSAIEDCVLQLQIFSGILSAQSRHNLDLEKAIPILSCLLK